MSLLYTVIALVHTTMIILPLGGCRELRIDITNILMTGSELSLNLRGFYEKLTKSKLTKVFIYTKVC